MPGDRLALALHGDHRGEAVPGAEVLHRVDVEPLALLVLSPFRSVDGPGQVWLLPRYPFARLAAGKVALGALLQGELGEAPPGDDRLVSRLEGADAAAAFPTVPQGFDFEADLFQRQGPGLLRPRRGERRLPSAHPLAPPQQRPVAQPERPAHLARAGAGPALQVVDHGDYSSDSVCFFLASLRSRSRSISRRSAVSARCSIFAERVFTFRRSALISADSSFDGRPGVSPLPGRQHRLQPPFFPLVVGLAGHPQGLRRRRRRHQPSPHFYDHLGAKQGLRIRAHSSGI